MARIPMELARSWTMVQHPTRKGVNASFGEYSRLYSTVYNFKNTIILTSFKSYRLKSHKKAEKKEQKKCKLRPYSVNRKYEKTFH
jgi:hypothetical protein